MKGEIVKGQIDPELRYKNWRDLPVCVFDLETTGLDPDEDKIVQACFMLFDNAYYMNYEDEFTTLVNPEILIPEDASRVHQICDDDVQNAPLFKDVADDILDFMTQADMLCAHNGLAFDIPFLQKSFYNIGYPVPTMPCVDTLVWERERRDKMSRNNLEECAKRCGAAVIQEIIMLEDADDKLHDARSDVLLLSQVLKERHEPLPYTLERLIDEQWGHHLDHQAYFDKKYGDN